MSDSGRYKEVVGICREKTRKAETKLELNLTAIVKENKKLFYKCINSKENLQPLLDVVGSMTIDDKEEAEDLNAFMSVFHSQISYLWGTF